MSSLVPPFEHRGYPSTWWEYGCPRSDSKDCRVTATLHVTVRDQGFMRAAQELCTSTVTGISVDGSCEHTTWLGISNKDCYTI